MKFSHCQVYISAPIFGQKDQHHINVPQLVEYIMENGGDVLDEHIKGETVEEMVAIVERRTGVNRLASDEPWKIVYQQDVEWVDAATHMILFVDSPSLGVGMELMRGLLKPELGHEASPILLLVHEDNLPKLSMMVRGIPEDKYQVSLATYRDFSDVTSLVDNFLQHHQ